MKNEAMKKLESKMSEIDFLRQDLLSADLAKKILKEENEKLKRQMCILKI